MITDIEEYFSKGCGRCKRFGTPQCSTHLWQAALRELRQICRQTGMAETVKWGHPVYVHAGRNIAIIGAFQDSCTLSFFNAALLKDPESLLQKAGPNTQHAGIIRLNGVNEVTKMQSAITAYLREAMGYSELGVVPPKQKRDLELPDELVDALDADPELAEAFRKLTPGRQRSYVINLSSAKTSATRLSRIGKFRARIVAGKGALER